jgi:hypothetical protein
LSQPGPAQFLSFLLVATVIGCAARQRPDEAAGAWTLGRPTTAEGSALAATLLTLRAGEQVYDIVDDDAAAPIAITMEPSNRFDASWSRHDGDRRTEFLREDEQGNVVMTAAIDHAESAVSLFDPPLIIAYASLSPAERRQQEVAIRVVDEKNAQKQKERGRAVQTIEYVGDKLIRIGKREFHVRQISIQFHADLRMADADTSTMLLIDDDHGPIVRERDEKIVILGVSSRSSRETIVLQIGQ